jgi:hypothetical protein
MRTDIVYNMDLVKSVTFNQILAASTPTTILTADAAVRRWLLGWQIFTTSSGSSFRLQDGDATIIAYAPGVTNINNPHPLYGYPLPQNNNAIVLNNLGVTLTTRGMVIYLEAPNTP